MFIFQDKILHSTLPPSFADFNLRPGKRGGKKDIKNKNILNKISSQISGKIFLIECSD